MYLTFMAALLAVGAHRRIPRANDAEQPHKTATSDLSALSDHQLRDIGYVRERFVVPTRHLLRIQ